MTAIGRCLGVSHRVGRRMSYCILTQKLTVISRNTVRCLTILEKDTDYAKASVSEFDIEINRRFKEEEDLTYNRSNPNPEEWYEYLEYEPDFQEDFD